MRKKTCPSLAVLLGGLALFTGQVARADFLPTYCCCPTATTVCRHPSPGLKLVIPSRPACCPCSVHYYGTCWHDAAAPDYGHCLTATSCVSTSHPVGLPLAPTPDLAPTPAKDKDAELPKPRTDGKQEAKQDAKPQGMNVIYHTDDPLPVSRQVWKPLPAR